MSAVVANMYMCMRHAFDDAMPCDFAKNYRMIIIFVRKLLNAYTHSKIIIVCAHYCSVIDLQKSFKAGGRGSPLINARSPLVALRISSLHSR